MCCLRREIDPVRTHVVTVAPSTIRVVIVHEVEQLHWVCDIASTNVVRELLLLLLLLLLLRLWGLLLPLGHASRHYLAVVVDSGVPRRVRIRGSAVGVGWTGVVARITIERLALLHS